MPELGMALSAQPTILILPGWQNSGPAHWQSLWEMQFGYERVLQHDWIRPLRGDWITRLEEIVLLKVEQTIQYSSRPMAKNEGKKAVGGIIFVAHSLGCHLVSAWAALSKNTHHVRGALLVAPPDGARETFPPELKSWRPPVLQTLPFPSICVTSSDDPLCDTAAARAMAACWGSRWMELPNKGHINAESGLGDWPQGQAFLGELMANG
jgi:uncharacterized protein